jgi:hypothetical protein
VGAVCFHLLGMRRKTTRTNACMFCAVPAPEYARNVINAGYNGSTKLLLLIVAHTHIHRASERALFCLPCAIFLVHAAFNGNECSELAGLFSCDLLFLLLLCAVLRCVYALKRCRSKTAACCAAGF